MRIFWRERMKAVIVTGVPGSGKTYERMTNQELASLPFVDIADVYRDIPDISWDAAVSAMLVKAEKLFLEGASTVVLEGIFLPGTPSRKLLEHELEDMRVDAEFILAHRSYMACRKGVIRSSEGKYETEKRLHLLDVYFDRAEALAEENGGYDN